jgi:hypothetical protein
MADVFISYSKPYVQCTRDLAADLEGKCLAVWWDTDLFAGEIVPSALYSGTPSLQSGDCHLDT